MNEPIKPVNTHKIINQLIQLQDLVAAYDEHSVSTPGTQLVELQESINTMLKSVPDPWRNHFLKMRQRGRQAIVPVHNGVCAGCGIALPIGLVYEVQDAQTLYACPSCARILFSLPASTPRHISPRLLKSEMPKAGIARFSSPELMIPKLKAATRDDAIQEMCARLEQAGFYDSGARLAELALRREAIVSTAVDNGLAFPHVRGVEGGLTLAVGLARKGIRFEESSRTLSRILFFLVIPASASAFYLKLLAGLTKTFDKTERREKLLKAETPEEMWKMISQATRKSIP